MGHTDSAPTPLLSSLEARVLEASLAGIRSDQRRLADAVQEISRNLAVLTRVEVNQNHTADHVATLTAQVKDHEQRMQSVERNMPQLLEMRKWVIMGILAGVGMMGTAVVKLVLVDGKVTPPAQNSSGRP